MLLTWMYRRCGSVLLDAGWIRQGAAVLSAGLRWSPDDVSTRQQWAWALGRLGQHEAAVREYRRILQRQPYNADFLLGLGVSLAKLGQHEEAIKVFRTASESRPDYPLVQEHLAESLRAIGQLRDALAAYRRVVNLTVDDAHAIGNLGATLGQLGHWEDAVECHQKAMTLSPNGVSASNLGVALRELGRLGEAEQAFRDALEFDAGSTELKVRLGEVLASQDRVQEATALLQDVLTAEPANVHALATLSAVLVSENKLDLAVETAKRAVASNRQDPMAHVALGWALLKLDGDAALASCDAALALDSANIYAAALRGAAFSVLGRHREAREAFNLVEAKAPTFFDRNDDFAPFLLASQATKSPNSPL